MFSTPGGRRIGWTILYTCLALFVLLVVATLLSTRQLAVEVRNTQLEGTPTGKKLLESAEIIKDCTTPEGDCYKRAQERTADAVGDINRVVIMAAACASGLPAGLSVDERQTEIQACVIDRLARQARKP